MKFGSGLGIVNKMGTVLLLILLSSHLSTEFFLFVCLFFIFRKEEEKRKMCFSNFQLYALILHPCVYTFVSLLQDQDVEDINQLFSLALYWCQLRCTAHLRRVKIL